MTYKEYLNLIKEYDTTDSVSRRKEITEEVYKTSVALAKQLEKMYNRFGATFINDDEYRPDRGGFSFNDFDEHRVLLTYSDHWKYGGECCFGVSVPMKMLDIENRIAERRNLREKQIDTLKKEYDANNSQIEELTKDNKTIIVRIAQLEKERDADSKHYTTEDSCENKESNK